MARLQQDDDPQDEGAQADVGQSQMSQMTARREATDVQGNRTTSEGDIEAARQNVKSMTQLEMEQEQEKQRQQEQEAEEKRRHREEQALALQREMEMARQRDQERERAREREEAEAKEAARLLAEAEAFLAAEEHAKLLWLLHREPQAHATRAWQSVPFAQRDTCARAYAAVVASPRGAPESPSWRSLTAASAAYPGSSSPGAAPVYLDPWRPTGAAA